MEDLDTEGLASSLEGFLDNALILKLKAQCVDGNTFKNLTAQNLILFGFSLKEVTDITQLLKDIQDGKVELTVFSIQSTANEPESRKRPVSLDTSIDSGTTDEIVNDNSEKSKSPSSEIPSSDSDSNSNSEGSKTTISEKYKPLLEFVDEKVLLKQSEFEKVNMLAKLNRWKSVKERGMAQTAFPSLGVTLKGQVTDDLTPARSGGGKKIKSGRQGKNNDEPVKQIKQRKQQPDRASKKKSVVFQEGDAENAEGEPKESNSDQRDPEWRADPNVNHNSDSDDNNQEDVTIDKENLLKPSFQMLSKDELLAIEPSLPLVDVETILLGDDEAKKLVPYLKEGYLIPSNLRKLAFRVLVHHLVDKQKSPKGVTSFMKHGLAKSIVTTFGQYQSPIEASNLTPWAHVFNPQKNSGHLANIIKRVQTALPLAARERKGKGKAPKKKKKRLNTEINLAALGIMMPNKENRDEIFDAMEKTFDIRCEDREEGISIASMLEKFPQFIHFNGDLILLEFKLQYPNAVDMCVTMAPLIPKIIEKWKDRRINPNCSERTVKAFMILASRLPHAIRKNMGTAFPQEDELIAVVKRNVALDTFVEERRTKSKTAVQPYLLAVQGEVTTDILKLFLVLDNELLPLKKMPFLRAIDVLFKSYIVFNVHYPESWSQFFRFLQTCFYKFLCSAKDTIPPSSIELFSHVTAL